MITLYRSGCERAGILTTKKEEQPVEEKKEIKTHEDMTCPECNSKMDVQNGCHLCPECGYSPCSI